MKRIIALALSLFMLFSFAAVNAQSSVKVVVNGQEVVFTDAAPFVDENSRTLVPLRAIGEAMGLKVDWNPDTNEAIFTKEYTWESSPLFDDYDNDGENDAYLGLEKVIFKIGADIATYEESWYDKGSLPNVNFPSMGGIGEFIMDTAAIINNERTYAPVRYLAEAFRYDVYWDSETETVLLSYMYSVYELGIKVEQVACWEDSQGFMLTANEDSDIQSVDIINVSINKNDSEYSILTGEEQSTIYEVGEFVGNYLAGFTVKNQLQIKNYYKYKVKFLVTMKDGTQKLGFVDIILYFDGGQGGYI